MYFLRAINSDRQTRLLNVLGQIAMILGGRKRTKLGVVSVDTILPNRIESGDN